MEFLLATLLTCESAEKIISQISLSTPNRSELVQVIESAAEKECFEDAND